MTLVRALTGRLPLRLNLRLTLFLSCSFPRPSPPDYSLDLRPDWGSILRKDIDKRWWYITQSAEVQETEGREVKRAWWES